MSSSSSLVARSSSLGFRSQVSSWGSGARATLPPLALRMPPPQGDALFELTDAILTADGAAPSPAHLSLQASHRRGWGSLYAALDRGRIDAEALRELLARHPLAGAEAEETPVYAVDTSVWARCDAECSPERGYYYHPSRHSAGQPIVAGWAYQFIAQLNFVRESWTAPVDVRRVRPAQDANVVAAEQVRSLLGRSSCEEGTAAPPCSSSTRATIPSRCSRAGGEPVPDPRPLAGGAPLLRRPEPLRPAGAHRTPSSPRAEDEVLDPSTWPEPSAEHRCEDAGYGSVRVRAWAELHPKVHNHEGGALGDPCPSWSARSSWSRSSVCPGARGGASRGFCGCGGTGRRGRRRTSISSGART